MQNYTVSLPHYSVGPDVYRLASNIIRPYGRKMAVIGGETTMAKANPTLLPALKAAGLTVTDVHVYGHDSTTANVETIMARLAIVSKKPMSFWLSVVVAVATRSKRPPI